MPKPTFFSPFLHSEYGEINKPVSLVKWFHLQAAVAYSAILEGDYEFFDSRPVGKLNIFD